MISGSRHCLTFIALSKCIQTIAFHGLSLSDRENILSYPSFMTYGRHQTHPIELALHIYFLFQNRTRTKKVVGIFTGYVGFMMMYDTYQLVKSWGIL